LYWTKPTDSGKKRSAPRPNDSQAKKKKGSPKISGAASRK